MNDYNIVMHLGRGLMMANFIQNVSLFFEPAKQKKSSPLEALKQGLDRAIVKYQLATGIETASSILGMSNSMDLVRIEGKDIRNLTDLRNRISNIKNEEKVWQMVEELLKAKDPVLSLCVADAVAQHLGEKHKFDLKGKSYSQLQELATHQGKKLIAHFEDKAGEMAAHPKRHTK